LFQFSNLEKVQNLRRTNPRYQKAGHEPALRIVVEKYNTVAALPTFSRFLVEWKTLAVRCVALRARQSANDRQLRVDDRRTIERTDELTNRRTSPSCMQHKIMKATLLAERRRTGPSKSFRIIRLNCGPSRTRNLLSGRRMPHFTATERAVLTLSPVTMRTVIPAR